MSSTIYDDELRPTTWDEFVGQERLKARLEVTIKAAIEERRLPDHMLLVAPPGTGKTTLASLVARELYVEFTSVKLPMNMDRFFDVVEETEGVLLLDEIHNAPRAFQEMLQPGLDEGRIRTPDGYEIDVREIVFIGATVTEFRSKLVAPLQQRFELQPKWEPYSEVEIAVIISGMAGRLGFEISDEVCFELASACGSTPRLAKRFVKAARDLQAVGRKVTAAAVLDHVGVDADGLGPEHLEYLEVVRSQGGRTGLRNLANLLCLTPAAVEDLERVLALKGLVHLGASGRRLTATGREKLKGVRNHELRSSA